MAVHIATITGGSTTGQAFYWHQGPSSYLSLNPVSTTFDPSSPPYLVQTEILTDAGYTLVGSTASPTGATANGITDSGVIFGAVSVGGEYVGLTRGAYWASSSAGLTILDDAAPFYLDGGVQRKNYAPPALGNNPGEQLPALMINPAGTIFGFGSADNSAAHTISWSGPAGELTAFSGGTIEAMNRAGVPVTHSYNNSGGLVHQRGGANLPFSWPVTAFSDAAPYVSVGYDQSAETGHIWDESLATAKQDVNIGSTYHPIDVSSPTDPTKVQVIANPLYGDPVLFEKTYPPAVAPATTPPPPIWNAPLSFNDLIAPGSGWHVDSVVKMNNGGAVIGASTYSGTNAAIATGSHGVILQPYKIEIQTAEASGQYQHIQELPIYSADSGTGTDITTTTTYDTFNVQLAANLTPGTAGSMTVQCTNSTGSFSGTLTETSGTSGIFHDTAKTFTVSMSPSTATSNSAIDALTVTVTSSSLGLSSTPMTLIETSASSLQFIKLQLDMDVTLNGTLSTSQPDTLVLHITSPSTYDLTMTETGNDTGVFATSDER